MTAIEDISCKLRELNKNLHSKQKTLEFHIKSTNEAQEKIVEMKIEIEEYNSAIDCLKSASNNTVGRASDAEFVPNKTIDTENGCEVEDYQRITNDIKNII